MQAFFALVIELGQSSQQDMVSKLKPPRTNPCLLGGNKQNHVCMGSGRLQSRPAVRCSRQRREAAVGVDPKAISGERSASVMSVM